VQVSKCALGWQLVASRRANDELDGEECALAWEQSLRPLLQRFDYAYVHLVGRDRTAVQLRVAHRTPVASDYVAAIDAAMELYDELCSTYEDRRRGISKRALVAGNHLLGFRLGGDVSAAGWLEDVLVEAQPAEVLRRWMLGPFAAPPLATATVARGRIVCNCHGVAESEIRAGIARGCGLEELQQALRCGTNCGSCLPELRRMLGVLEHSA
jgi:assimilatory nitrate reductase catalytic subunit